MTICLVGSCQYLKVEVTLQRFIIEQREEMIYQHHLSWCATKGAKRRDVIYHD